MALFTVGASRHDRSALKADIGAMAVLPHFGTRDRNAAIAPGTAQRLAELAAADLVRINVDVIVTSGTSQVL